MTDRSTLNSAVSSTVNSEAYQRAHDQSFELAGELHRAIVSFLDEKDINDSRAIIFVTMMALAAYSAGNMATINLLYGVPLDELRERFNALLEANYEAIDKAPVSKVSVQ